MVTVYAVLVVMLMAIDAAKYCIVAAIGMAVSAKIPFTLMFPAVDGEIIRIMIKCCRRPRALIVTLRTIGRKLSSTVVRVGSIVIVGLVTSDTSGGRIREGGIMTTAAIVGYCCVGTQ